MVSVGIAGQSAFKQDLKEVRELATDRRGGHSRQRVQSVMHRPSEYVQEVIGRLAWMGLNK